MTGLSAGRHSKINVLRVFLGEREVGTITRFPDDRSLFTFDETYLLDSSRPTLSLSFKTRDGGVRAPGLSRTRLTPFFSNLLPEGHLRAYLAGRAGIGPAREFYLLWLLGQDLPGAVLVRPEDGDILPPSQDDAADHVAAADVLRFSLAGVQLKFSAVMEADGGLTIPAHGVGGDWIVKLPSHRFPAVPEMEYAMMELARTVGIDVPEVRLLQPAQLTNVPEGLSTLGVALAIRRFDRPSDGSRVHIEDFAQIFGEYAHRKYERASYENLAEVLWIESGLASVLEFTRRLAFSVLIGNADMHLKNWSVIYDDPASARIAPAYDLVATVPYLDDPALALSLGSLKDMYSVDTSTFRRFAGKVGIPENAVLDAVNDIADRVRQEWERHPALDRVPGGLRSKLKQHIDRVQLGKGA